MRTERFEAVGAAPALPSHRRRRHAGNHHPRRPTRASVALRALVLAAATAGLLAVTAGQASASDVTCGDAITTDTTLGGDLVACPNNGIVIGADDITLDLNGHTIGGDGELEEACADDQFCDVGVVNDGHSRVTIKGGPVREFGLAVLVLGASDNRLLDLSATNSIFSGVVIADSARVQLERSAIVANGLHTDEGGVALFASSQGRIAHNSISGNGDTGIFALEANDTVFERNELSDNPEAGMLLEESNRNVFDRNRLSRNGQGITVGGDGNRITRNRVFDSDAGLPDEGGLGIRVEGLEDASDNVVERNVVARASRAGIQVSAVNTVVRHNRLRGNGDGVSVLDVAENTLLEGNHASGSEDDGIDVDSPATTLIANHAVHNLDLGIEAVAGVTDGGGNKASGNGTPAQCTNVACT